MFNFVFELNFGIRYKSKIHFCFVFSKLGDIGRTVLLQCNAIFRWAKLATMHSVGGLGSLVGAAEAASSSSNQPHGIFLVAQLSSKGNLITPQYTKGKLKRPFYIFLLVFFSFNIGPLRSIQNC